MPTFGSLFAGIGGIDLGLERAGWEVRWQVEIDPFCRAVLEKHWPDVTRYGDVREIDWNTVERVDLIAGGFPCQPVSTAGKRKGRDDPRWLWPYFADAVRHLRPRFVLMENVTGLLSVNNGEAMGEILGDLAALGYNAEWEVLPAAAFGAPHLRERVFIVAYTRKQGLRCPDEGRQVRCAEQTGRAVAAGVCGAASYSDGRGCAGKDISAGQAGQCQPIVSGMGAVAAHPDGAGLEGCRVFRERPRKSPAWARLEEESIFEIAARLCGVDDGVPHRVDRIRTLGNAVVPQVAEYVGRMILKSVGGV